jgi:GR25 family glycosyltransferase involved in LPS biosynthesis
MSIAYKIFHLEKDTSRANLVKYAEEYLSQYYTKFDTETIQISNIDDYKDFISKYPNFKIDPQGYNLNNQQGWRWGEIGILASNWLAWNKFQESDFDVLMLMEDDIIIYDHFDNTLNNYISELPESWDIFHFYVPLDQYNKYNLGLDHGKHVCRAYQDWSCLCYLISKSGIKKLVDSFNDPVSLPLDWHMFRQMEKFNIYTIKPDAEYGCTLAEMNSTFQLTQDRNIINGIL